MFLKFFLKEAAISGDAINYLAASEKIEGISEKFYKLSNKEIPVPHAKDAKKVKKIYEISERLTNI